MYGCVELQIPIPIAEDNIIFSNPIAQSSSFTTLFSVRKSASLKKQLCNQNTSVIEGVYSTALRNFVKNIGDLDR